MVLASVALSLQKACESTGDIPSMVAYANYLATVGEDDAQAEALFQRVLAAAAEGCDNGNAALGAAF